MVIGFNGYILNWSILGNHLLFIVLVNAEQKIPPFLSGLTGTQLKKSRRRDDNAGNAWYQYLGFYAQVPENNLKEIYLMKNIEMTVEEETLYH